MLIKIGSPMLQCGYTPLDIGLGVELLGLDLDLGAWSLGLQFLSWWVSLTFQFLVAKEVTK